MLVTATAAITGNLGSGPLEPDQADVIGAPDNIPHVRSPIDRAMSAIPSGELSRRSAQHLTVSQLRQPARQTLVESRRPASTRRSAATDGIAFGHGLDPHDHVLADRIPTDGGYARGDHLDVPSTDQRHPATGIVPASTLTSQQILQRCAHLGDRATLTTRIKPPPAPPQRRARQRSSAYVAKQHADGIARMDLTPEQMGA